MARAFAAHWPIVRITFGKSLGPTTTRATIKTKSIWLQLKSTNMLAA